jgi:hypothetical protein
VPELSGSDVPPDSVELSSPVVQLTLHPIGGTLPIVSNVAKRFLSSLCAQLLSGFCAISTTLPLPEGLEIESATQSVEGGLNSTFGAIVHCAAAEPHATFLRIGVADCGREVAFETIALGRLRRGYRVFHVPLHDSYPRKIDLPACG